MRQDSVDMTLSAAAVHTSSVDTRRWELHRPPTEELLLRKLFIYITDLDVFIVGNKQPGSCPSPVNYVNSSVRCRDNKTFGHKDVKTQTGGARVWTCSNSTGPGGIVHESMKETCAQTHKINTPAFDARVKYNFISKWCNILLLYFFRNWLFFP